jgi:hypothetical protein
MVVLSTFLVRSGYIHLTFIRIAIGYIICKPEQHMTPKHLRCNEHVLSLSLVKPALHHNVQRSVVTKVKRDSLRKKRIS